MLLAQISKPSLSDAGTELKHPERWLACRKPASNATLRFIPAECSIVVFKPTEQRHFDFSFKSLCFGPRPVHALVTRSAFLPRCGDRGEAASAFTSVSVQNSPQGARRRLQESGRSFDITIARDNRNVCSITERPRCARPNKSNLKRC